MGKGAFETDEGLDTPTATLVATSLAASDPLDPVRHRAIAAAVPLFAVTVLLSSGLLFLVQPMFARLVLPRLGGSPSVWNTCVLFFQTVLLLGYLYAHLSTRWLGTPRQAQWHLILLLMPVLVLPLTVGDEQPPPAVNPVWWLLGTMTIRAGLPFFVVSASAPLLQRWFASLPVLSARDPYFLYAASNFGSMVALLGYPLLLEPLTGVGHQTWIWTVGYAALVILLGACAMLVRGFGQEKPPETIAVSLEEAVSIPTRLRWVVLSFVPSSLMLGVTTHISTDIAAVPLLWVLPLALYLATFVLAFASKEGLSHRWLVRLLPPLVFACLCTVLVNSRAAWLIPLHLTAFFVCALVCHRELARRRPHVHHLTEFYIWMSLGGMLGGVLNSLIAPQIFSGILEYPLVLAFAALVRPSPGFRGSRQESYGIILGWPAFVLLLCGGLWIAGLMPDELGAPQLLVSFALVLTVAYMLANRTEPFGAMALLLVAIIAFVRPTSAGSVLFAGRSFFGVHRVIDAPDHSYHLLQHGSTTHGRQQMSGATHCEQTGYYHPSSPIGQLFATTAEGFRNVGVIGLGSGALACYAKSGDAWTFYEIDPMIERIAKDSRYFTYLQNSAARLNVVLGDGRMTLQRADPSHYDLIVLDAFSSDAIPVHLLTGEAIRLYLSRLTHDGVIAIHISNGYLNLEPVVGQLALRDSLFALANLDDQIPEADAKMGRLASHWVVLSRAPQALAGLVGRAGWRSPEIKDRVTAWTDDYSNILRVLKFH